MEDLLAVVTVQQQQAEQMKVFWKVRGSPSHLLNAFIHFAGIVYRRNVDEFGTAESGSNTDNAQTRSWIRPDDRTTGSLHGGCTKRRTCDSERRAVEAQSFLVADLAVFD